MELDADRRHSGPSRLSNRGNNRAVTKDLGCLRNNIHGTMIHTTIQLGRSLDPAIVGALRLSERALKTSRTTIQALYEAILSGKPHLAM